MAGIRGCFSGGGFHLSLIHIYACLGGNRYADYIAAPLLGNQLVLRELLHNPVRIGLGLIHLVDGHDDGYPRRLGAVSYTHLDVYKRQLFMPAISRMDILMKTNSIQRCWKPWSVTVSTISKT